MSPRRCAAPPLRGIAAASVAGVAVEAVGPKAGPPSLPYMYSPLAPGIFTWCAHTVLLRVLETSSFGLLPRFLEKIGQKEARFLAF